MSSAELVELQYQLDVIQASLQKNADRLKSERDPVEIANCEFCRKGWQILEQIALTRISLYYVDSEIAQWEEELFSPAIDTAPPVTLEEFIETETPSAKVLPSHSYHSHDVLPMPFPPPRSTIPRQLSRRQYVEEQLQAAKDRMTALGAEILQHEGEFAEWMKMLASNEFPKKLTSELVQMGNRVSTSAASRKKKRKRKPKPVGPPVERPASVPASPKLTPKERVTAYLCRISKPNSPKPEFNREQFWMVAGVDSADGRRWQLNKSRSQTTSDRIENALKYSRDKFESVLNSRSRR